MHECPLCKNELLRVEVDTSGDVLRARPCSCRVPCALCGNRGFTFEPDASGYSVAKPCSCEGLRGRARFFGEANLPARYVDATLEGFKPAPFQRPAHHAAYVFAREYVDGRRGLLFYGNCGTGKTHLGVAILRHLVARRGIRVRFVEFKHLIAELREAFSGVEGRASTLMRSLVEVPVLLVDELGKGARREWEQDVLDELISRRYNARRTTLFTTNYPVGGSEPAGETLEARIGVRIQSRLDEMCDKVVLNGEDMRRRAGRNP
jgi:DNA replication protein DnaC